MATILSCAKAGASAPAVRIAGPEGPAPSRPGADGSTAGETEPDGAPLRVEQVRPTVFQLTLGAFDLAALIAGARWAASGGAPRGELPPKTQEQLRGLLARYDEQWRRI